jgi:hypothetical protein
LELDNEDYNEDSDPAMTKPPSVRLRQDFPRQQLWARGEPKNPFAAARKHEPVRPLIVGIHSGGLRRRPKKTGLLIRQEICRAHPGVVRLLRSEGPLPSGIEGDLDIVTIKQELGETRVSAVIRKENRRSEAGVNGRVSYQHIVEKHGLEPSRLADFFEVEGLAAHGADIVITEQPDLLVACDRGLLNNLPIMTPEEAFVVVGVWSRLIHKTWVRGPWGVNVGRYYLCLGRALTPAARPFFASIGSQKELRHRDEVSELEMSVLHGLARLARRLDQMVALWQCPSDNEINDELFDEFDDVVRDVWRVYDNLALLSGYYLDIPLDHGKPTLWGLLTDDWKQAMKRSGAVGRAVASLVSTHTPRFRISQQLRHRAIHRAQLRNLTLQEWGGPRKARIELEGQELLAFERAAKAMGHPAEAWGLDQTVSAGLLDPMILAPRLVAHAAYMTNRIFEILQPQNDPDPSTIEMGSAPEDVLFQPYAANSAILSSPLSGLIDWQLPLDGV